MLGIMSGFPRINKVLAGVASLALLSSEPAQAQEEIKSPDGRHTISLPADARRVLEENNYKYEIVNGKLSLCFNDVVCDGLTTNKEDRQVKTVYKFVLNKDRERILVGCKTGLKIDGTQTREVFHFKQTGKIMAFEILPPSLNEEIYKQCFE
jgi:hypothetical protein